MMAEGRIFEGTEQGEKSCDRLEQHPHLLSAVVFLVLALAFGVLVSDFTRFYHRGNGNAAGLRRDPHLKFVAPVSL